MGGNRQLRGMEPIGRYIGISMKKNIYLFIAVILTAAMVCGMTGCVKKKSAHAQIDYSKKGEYVSLIEKYVGEPGEPYRAYDEIVKWDFYFGTIDCMYPKEEWIDSEGKLSLPFDIEEAKTLYDGETSYAAYYIPDELAVNASTGELVDIALDFFVDMNIGYLRLAGSFDYGFEFWLRRSNALEESLRRDDFAQEYLERYLAADFPSDMESFHRFNIMEVVLAQPEACEQLTDEQRTAFVKKVIDGSALDEQIELYYELGISYTPYFFEFVTEGNAWYYAINEMDLTDEEWAVIDSYVEWNQ